MSQEPPMSPGYSGSSFNRSAKPEVDLFPALADRSRALSVVAPRAAINGPQISMFEPTTYEEALDIVECLRSRASTTVCLDKMRKAEANRLVDFISGASAAIDGNFHQLSDQVYLFAPSNVQIVVSAKDEFTESPFLATPSYMTQSSWSAPATQSGYGTSSSSYTTPTTQASQPTMPTQNTYTSNQGTYASNQGYTPATPSTTSSYGAGATTSRSSYTSGSQATSGGFAAWDQKVTQRTPQGGTGSVPPLNGEPLDLLYPDTGNQPGNDSIWTKRPN